MTSILGISAFYHDSAAALVVDLAEAGLTPAELDYVGFYDKPIRKFERLLETYLAYAPRGLASFREAMPVWLGQSNTQKRWPRARGPRNIMMRWLGWHGLQKLTS